MQTISLKLLNNNFCLGTYFERLPLELIEYIVRSFIMIPENRIYFFQSLHKICLKGIFKATISDEGASILKV